MKRHASRLVATAVALGLATGIVHAQQPTPSHLETARTVVLSSGIARSFDAFLPQILQQIRQTLTTRPEMTKDLEEVIVKTTPDFERAKSEMVEAAARIYSAQLTEPELKEIVVFFASSAGKRYVETQPAVLEQMFAEMDDWSKTLSAVVIERIRDEMKKRGHEF